MKFQLSATTHIGTGRDRNLVGSFWPPPGADRVKLTGVWIVNWPSSVSKFCMIYVYQDLFYSLCSYLPTSTLLLYITMKAWTKNSLLKIVWRFTLLELYTQRLPFYPKSVNFRFLHICKSFCFLLARIPFVTAFLWIEWACMFVAYLTEKGGSLGKEFLRHYHGKWIKNQYKYL